MSFEMGNHTEGPLLFGARDSYFDELNLDGSYPKSFTGKKKNLSHVNLRAIKLVSTGSVVVGKIRTERLNNLNFCQNESNKKKVYRCL